MPDEKTPETMKWREGKGKSSSLFVFVEAEH